MTLVISLSLAGKNKLLWPIQRFSSQQNQVLRWAGQSFHQMPVELLLQGSPSNSMTTWITGNIALCYSFVTMKAAQTVSLFETSLPLHDLAAKSFQQFRRINWQDRKRFPLTIREHSVETWISIYKRVEALKWKAKTCSRAQPLTRSTKSP